MGLKAIIYFEIATTAALAIGLAVVNLTKPGVGVALVAGPNDVVNTVAQTHPKTLP
jgi:Na+/H+-dicarboxylate symporter